MTSPAACAPPRRFRPAGQIVEAHPEASGPFNTNSLRGRSAAQKAGIRYERKVLKELSAEFPGEFLPSQWFRFDDGSPSIRWCQVDGLRVAPSHVTIFEVKSSFCAEAGYQLRHLYLPVVRNVYPTLPVDLVVICKTFDPNVAFPEAYSIIDHLSRVVPETICVLPWRL